jgi:hypothetical protein
VSLAWLVTGRTVGGTPLYPSAQRIDREQALRLWTESNAWFSSEIGKKGALRVGQLADLAVLSDDYFRVPEEGIADISSVLTVLGGRVVHGEAEFSKLAPPMPPAMPDWSPARCNSPLARAAITAAKVAPVAPCVVHGHHGATSRSAPTGDVAGFWGAFGCSCWAF